MGKLTFIFTNIMDIRSHWSRGELKLCLRKINVESSKWDRLERAENGGLEKSIVDH